MRMRITILLGLALLAHATAQAAPPPRCLYVSSYHSGYEWNDGIERGMDAVLQGKCELKKFYMDGKRHLDETFAKTKAREAKELDRHLEAGRHHRRRRQRLQVSHHAVLQERGGAGGLLRPELDRRAVRLPVSQRHRHDRSRPDRAAGGGGAGDGQERTPRGVSLGRRDHPVQGVRHDPGAIPAPRHRGHAHARAHHGRLGGRLHRGPGDKPTFS